MNNTEYTEPTQMINTENITSETRQANSFLFDDINAYDDIANLLDSYVEKGWFKVIVYESGFDIVNYHIPNHGLTDDDLEMIIKTWVMEDEIATDE